MASQPGSLAVDAMAGMPGGASLVNAAAIVRSTVSLGQPPASSSRDPCTSFVSEGIWHELPMEILRISYDPIFDQTFAGTQRP